MWDLLKWGLRVNNSNKKQVKRETTPCFFWTEWSETALDCNALVRFCMVMQSTSIGSIPNASVCSCFETGITSSLPSREVTYPIPKAFLSRRFSLFFSVGYVMVFLEGKSVPNIISFPKRSVILMPRCPRSGKLKVTWLMVRLMAQYLRRSRKSLNRFLAVCFLLRDRDMIWLDMTYKVNIWYYIGYMNIFRSE